MKLHCMLKHKTTGKTLVIKENGIYDLPYTISDVDDKKIIMNYLNDVTNNGFIERDFDLYCGSDENDKYYFCIHSIQTKHAKMLSKDFEWFNDEDIVDKVTDNNACKFLQELKDLILNPISTEEWYRIFDEMDRLDRLKNMPIGYLTEDEAKDIDKYDVWHRVYMAVFEEVRKCLPKNIKMDIFEEELKAQGKDEFTPKIFADVYYKYKDKNSEEIRRIIKRNSPK